MHGLQLGCGETLPIQSLHALHLSRIFLLCGGIVAQPLWQRVRCVSRLAGLPVASDPCLSW